MVVCPPFKVNLLSLCLIIIVVYGYGTLMVILLSLLSLIGVFIVPLVKQNERCGHVYDYVNLFLIAMGTSALFSDAVLHLIPQVKIINQTCDFELLLHDDSKSLLCHWF